MVFAHSLHQSKWRWLTWISVHALSRCLQTFVLWESAGIQLRVCLFGILQNKNVFLNIFRNIFWLFCSWEPEWKSRYSGIRIAPKQTLTRIIPIILIPYWSQTNTSWELFSAAKLIREPPCYVLIMLLLILSLLWGQGISKYWGGYCRLVLKF